MYSKINNKNKNNRKTKNLLLFISTILISLGTIACGGAQSKDMTWGEFKNRLRLGESHKSAIINCIDPYEVFEDGDKVTLAEVKDAIFLLDSDAIADIQNLFIEDGNRKKAERRAKMEKKRNLNSTPKFFHREKTSQFVKYIHDVLCKKFKVKLTKEISNFCTNEIVNSIYVQIQKKNMDMDMDMEEKMTMEKKESLLKEEIWKNIFSIEDTNVYNILLNKLEELTKGCKTKKEIKEMLKNKPMPSTDVIIDALYNRNSFTTEELKSVEVHLSWLLFKELEKEYSFKRYKAFEVLIALLGGTSGYKYTLRNYLNNKTLSLIPIHRLHFTIQSFSKIKQKN